MDEMQWMMLPLAKLLNVFLPGHFESQLNGEWLHVELPILLVKGCSGMNFFVMSFVGYTIVFNQVQRQFLCGTLLSSINSKWIQDVSKIVCALLVAWLTTLVVNVIRIMLALFFFENTELVQLTGLNDESAHRLAGLIVYIPALFLQMKVGRCFEASKSFAIVAGLMIVLLIVVPLITANAFNHYDTFIRHSIWLISFIGVGGMLVVIFGAKRKGRHENDLKI